MIRPMDKSAPVPRATGVCDGCGREEVITCDYERVGREIGWRVNEGQAVRKLTGMGWALVKGRLNCPACEAKRKAKAATSKTGGGHGHHIRSAAA